MKVTNQSDKARKVSIINRNMGKQRQDHEKHYTDIQDSGETQTDKNRRKQLT